jgi:hypothetical protein
MEAGELPVAVQDPRVFAQLHFYASPKLKKRLIYLTNPEESLRRAGTDIPERAVTGFARITSFRVRKYFEFISERNEFLVYWHGVPTEAAPSPAGAPGTLIGWLLPKLSEDGAEVRVVGQKGSQLLFHVRTAIPKR